MASSVVCLLQHVPKTMLNSFLIGLNRPLGHNFVLRKNFSKSTATCTQQSSIGKKLSTLKEGYEHFLQTRFPLAFRIYQVFGIGTKELFLDVKLWYTLTWRMMKERNLNNFTRLEIEKYYQVPRDAIKVIPTITIAALPLANWIILPLAYKFPRQLLSPHFWTPEEKVDFALIKHRQKLVHYRPTFQLLKDYKHHIKAKPELESVENIFQKLESGNHPSSNELQEIQVVFRKRPYGLMYLSSAHLSSLCKIHGLSHRFPMKRKRLIMKASFIKIMDMAMSKEGVQDMSIEELRYASFFRGLNPIGLTREEICEWLKNWLSVTNSKDISSSMMLHCPIFLSYNYSSNSEYTRS